MAKSLELPISIILDEEILALVTVPQVLLTDWLLTLCLMRLGTLDSVTLVNISSSPATIIIHRDASPNARETANLFNDGLTLVVNNEFLDAWIVFFLRHYEQAAPVDDDEVTLRIPADKIRMGLDVTLVIALEGLIEGEPGSSELMGEIEQQVLTLLHQINNPVSLHAARQLETLLARLDRPDLEDLEGDIWSTIETMKHVPELAGMLRDTFTNYHDDA